MITNSFKTSKQEYKIRYHITKIAQKTIVIKTKIQENASNLNEMQCEFREQSSYLYKIFWIGQIIKKIRKENPYHYDLLWLRKSL